MSIPSALPVKAILTGATGMVGEGVLHQCLADPRVEAVLVIGRRPCGVAHPKLKELILPDVADLSGVEGQLAGYNACFFCLGVSSLGKTEAQYTRLTHELTLAMARPMAQANARQTPGMRFFYVSGAGTDSTEKGRVMWARVKGKTENDLRRVGFLSACGVRPAFIQPTPGLKHAHQAYFWVGWLFPVLRVVAPRTVCTLRQLGLALISAASQGYEAPVMEVPDILALAKQGASPEQK